MTGLRRQIVKTAGRASLDAQDVLASVLIAELLSPGEEFYVVSGWISDVQIIDNAAGTYSSLEPAWEERWITLSEVLAALARRGTYVRIKTNDDPHNRAFAERLRADAHHDGTEDRVQVRQVPDAHSKGMVGESFALRGSMNLTYNGLRKREETVELDVDTEAVATFRLEFREDWAAEQERA